MRKAWITLVVFGILLCMFASLGVAANAAEANDPISILAVNGDHLEEDYIALLKGGYEHTYVIDVAGGESETDHAGYDIVFMGAAPEEAEPTALEEDQVLAEEGQAPGEEDQAAETADEAQDVAVATGPVTGSITGPVEEPVDEADPASVEKEEESSYTPLYVGQTITYKTTLASGVEQIVTFVGVDGSLTADDIRAALADVEGHFIAIGTPEAAKAVEEAGVELLLTVNVPEDLELNGTTAVIDLRDTEEGEEVISVINIDEEDKLSVDTIPLSSLAVGGPGMGPAEPSVDEPGVGPDMSGMGGNDDPMTEDPGVGPVVPEEQAPPAETTEPEPEEEEPPVVTYTLTYAPGEGAGEAVQNAVESDKNLIILSEFGFEAPSGKEFAGWLINGEVHDAKTEFTVEGDVEAVAQYKDVAPEEPANVPVTDKDPGFVEGETIDVWQIGGNDTMMVSFTDAKIKTVSIGTEQSAGAVLTPGEGYFTIDDDKTAVIIKDYLDALEPADYTITFSFENDEDGSGYKDMALPLSVEPGAAGTEAEFTETWDRTVEFTHDFVDRTPNKLEIKFGEDDWREATLDKDYKVEGNKLIMLPAMVNGGSRWQAWDKGGHTFRVSFTSGDPVVFGVTLEGDVPVATPEPTAEPTVTPAPTATPAPTHNPNGAPATGDTTNFTPYIIILVVCAVAAVAVVVVMMKRKKN